MMDSDKPRACVHEKCHHDSQTRITCACGKMDLCPSCADKHLIRPEIEAIYKAITADNRIALDELGRK